MAKSAKPKCCPPRPFIFTEILLGGGEETEATYYELREDGGRELLEDNSNELREY